MGQAAAHGAAPRARGPTRSRPCSPSCSASPSRPRCSRPTRAGWSSCARTSWSASSTTSARSRTGSPSDSRELETSRDRLVSGVDSSAEALEVRPGAARHPGHPHRHLAGHRTRASSSTSTTPTTRSPPPVCSTPSRSCATPAPRPCRSVTCASCRTPGSPTSTARSRSAANASSPPYVIKAIGDSATMASAMEIPGGVSESVRGDGALPSVRQSDDLAITALHSLSEPRYARPVPAPSP